jgi:hypothetical protein
MAAPAMFAVIETLYDHVPNDGVNETVTLPPPKSAVRLPDPSTPGTIVPSEPVGLVAPIRVNGILPDIGMLAVGSPAT